VVCHQVSNQLFAVQVETKNVHADLQQEKIEKKQKNTYLMNIIKQLTKQRQSCEQIIVAALNYTCQVAYAIIYIVFFLLRYLC